MSNNLSHLNWRYSVKKFDSSKKIPDNVFSELLEVLRLAPSSFGLQPWRFVVVKDQNLRNELVKHSYNQSQVADASHLIVLCSLKSIDESYVKNFIKDLSVTRNIPIGNLTGYESMISGFVKNLSHDSLSSWMKYQVYLALGMLLSECARLNIDASPMEGFDSKKYNELLGLDKDGIQSVVLCPVGFRSVDDKTSSMKKVRLPISDLVFYK